MVRLNEPNIYLKALQLLMARRLGSCVGFLWARDGRGTCWLKTACSADGDQTVFDFYRSPGDDTSPVPSPSPPSPGPSPVPVSGDDTGNRAQSTSGPPQCVGSASPDDWDSTIITINVPVHFAHFRGAYCTSRVPPSWLSTWLWCCDSFTMCRSPKSSSSTPALPVMT